MLADMRRHRSPRRYAMVVLDATVSWYETQSSCWGPPRRCGENLAVGTTVPPMLAPQYGDSAVNLHLFH